MLLSSVSHGIYASSLTVTAIQESLDLRYLVQVAVVEETRIRELKLPISEARVSTLIRSPCIAIRYVTATSKVGFLAFRDDGNALMPSCRI